MDRCNDKVLRGTLKNYIIQDVRNINKKKSNMQLNSVEKFLHLIIFYKILPNIAKLSIGFDAGF